MFFVHSTSPGFMSRAPAIDAWYAEFAHPLMDGVLHDITCDLWRQTWNICGRMKVKRVTDTLRLLSRNFNFIISQVGNILRLLVYKVPPESPLSSFFFSFPSDNFCMLVLYRFYQHGTLPVSDSDCKLPLLYPGKRWKGRWEGNVTVATWGQWWWTSWNMTFLDNY